ncbi:hypothetical protein BSR28_04670 [Boudabousia liubingyangii]|uniref:class C sortase n=1 Tax=Boudabousia liubingyangii TaxID=1921764 RepID=UPI0009395F69|nr:class C sortase [Boudabousia liubingyangii]OKL46745.1 hypothetical protein BSR28_04670 [Boudabousia liubingyangii]
MTQTAIKSDAPKRNRNKPKRNLQLLAPLIGALLGIAMLLYPVISTRQHNAEQQRIANESLNVVKDLTPTQKNTLLEEADEYNRELASGLILDPFIEDVAPNSPEYKQYLQKLNADEVMGTVRVPAVNINLPIYHGTFDDVLQKGVGHLFGSSLPVGGVDTHSVLTGHTGLPNATLFDHLDKVKKGDDIYLSVAGRNLKYKVNDIRVVKPEETSSLVRQPGRDLVTLITCTPYGINSHRLLVTGERVPMEKTDEAKVLTPQPIENPWEWWMIGLVAGASVAGLLVLLLIYMIFFGGRKKDEEEDDNQNPAAAAEETAENTEQ